MTLLLANQILLIVCIFIKPNVSHLWSLKILAIKRWFLSNFAKILQGRHFVVGGSSNKICFQKKKKKKIEDLRIPNMITGINESKPLTKHISCECKCKFVGRKCNSDQWWNNSKCWSECKKRHVLEKKLYLKFFYM